MTDLVQDSPVMKMSVLAPALILLAGCATNPITGREQILALPAMQAAYAEVGFALSAGAQRIAPTPSCERDCGSAEDLARFSERAEKIGAELEASARSLSPDLFGRIGSFQIEVNGSLGVGTASSAGGRIALGTGLAGLEPDNTVIAFLIAREMGHVIARHAEENSGASLLFSALGMLLPVLNLAVRFAATTLGSGALKSTWAMQQQREADEIAIALLERAGLPVAGVALSLENGIRRARLSDDEWCARYSDSAWHVALIAASEAPAGNAHFASGTLK